VPTYYAVVRQMFDVLSALFTLAVGNVHVDCGFMFCAFLLSSYKPVHDRRQTDGRTDGRTCGCNADMRTVAYWCQLQSAASAFSGWLHWPLRCDVTEMFTRMSISSAAIGQCAWACDGKSNSCSE